VVGNLAFVAAGFGGLVIENVANPASPTLVGSFATGGFANAVSVASGYAAVAIGYNGIVVVDVSEPSAPRLVGYYDTQGYAFAVQVAGPRAYIADGVGGLVITEFPVLAFRPLSRLGNQVLMTWDGPVAARLQRASRLSPANWAEVTNTAGAVGALVSMSGTNGFYRLFTPATPAARFTTPVHTGGGFLVSWGTNQTARLQQATRLTTPDWRELSGTNGLIGLLLPADKTNDFYRLMLP
jgi:hypothetical protein